ncbi:MAG: hypothetical protein IPM36_09245 [Lewinellaceae bacterium]|nr:hypothetical protein [Lewinellaceae bacterium]
MFSREENVTSLGRTPSFSCAPKPLPLAEIRRFVQQRRKRHSLGRTLLFHALQNPFRSLETGALFSREENVTSLGRTLLFHALQNPSAACNPALCSAEN